MKYAAKALPGWFAPAKSTTPGTQGMPTYDPFGTQAKQEAQVEQAAADQNLQHLKNGTWLPANSIVKTI